MAGKEPPVDETLPPEAYIEETGEEYIEEEVYPEEEEVFMEEEDDRSCAGTCHGVGLGLIVFFVGIWLAWKVYNPDTGTFLFLHSAGLVLLFWISFNMIGSPLLWVLEKVPMLSDGCTCGVSLFNFAAAILWTFLLSVLMPFGMYVGAALGILLVILVVFWVLRSGNEDEEVIYEEVVEEEVPYEEEYIEEEVIDEDQGMNDELIDI